MHNDVTTRVGYRWLLALCQTLPAAVKQLQLCGRSSWDPSAVQLSEGTDQPRICSYPSLGIYRLHAYYRRHGATDRSP